MLYTGKLSFRIEGQIKSFPARKKLKEFIITKPLLYEILKGIKKKDQNYEQKRRQKIQICQQWILKNKLSKKNRDRIIYTESVLMVPERRVVWGNG